MILEMNDLVVVHTRASYDRRMHAETKWIQKSLFLEMLDLICAKIISD